jgi:hypothetical protein
MSRNRKGNGTKNRLGSLALASQRLLQAARRLGSNGDPADMELLGKVEEHLATAARLLDLGRGESTLPERPNSPAGVLEFTQLMLRNEGRPVGGAGRAPSQSAPSERHRLLLHAKVGLVSTPDFVAFLCQAQQSGILQVFTAKEVFSIEIEDGDVVHAHSDGAPAGERLGDILVQQGVLDTEQLGKLLTGDARARLGSRMLEQQLVSRDELVTALETQIRHLFHRLFTAEPREFLFWGGPCLLAEQSLRLNANMLLLDSARAADEAAR